MMNKKFALILAVGGSLFSGTVAAASDYLPASIGNLQPGGVASISATFSLGETITFTLTGDNAEGASLAAVPADKASVASARGAQASEGVLPNGTYTFVDENGGEARVRVEDGELIPLH